MGYTTRILADQELVNLPTKELAALRDYVSSESMRVVVVEDGTRIVGAWAIVTMIHLEGVWIDPAYRHKAGVVRALLQRTFHVASQLTNWVITGSTTPYVTRLVVKHLRGVQLPGESFIVPVGERACPPPS